MALNVGAAGIPTTPQRPLPPLYIGTGRGYQPLPARRPDSPTSPLLPNRPPSYGSTSSSSIPSADSEITPRPQSYPQASTRSGDHGPQEDGTNNRKLVPRRAMSVGGGGEAGDTAENDHEAVSEDIEDGLGCCGGLWRSDCCCGIPVLLRDRVQSWEFGFVMLWLLRVFFILVSM